MPTHANCQRVRPCSASRGGNSTAEMEVEAQVEASPAQPYFFFERMAHTRIAVGHMHCSATRGLQRPWCIETTCRQAAMDSYVWPWRPYTQEGITGNHKKSPYHRKSSYHQITGHRHITGNSPCHHGAVNDYTAGNRHITGNHQNTGNETPTLLARQGCHVGF